MVRSLSLLAVAVRRGAHDALARGAQAVLELAHAPFGEEQVAAALDGLAGDEHGVDIGLLGVVDDHVRRVAARKRWEYRRPVAADDREVGLLPHGEGADLLLEAERARAADRRPLQRLARGHGVRRRRGPAAGGGELAVVGLALVLEGV